MMIHDIDPRTSFMYNCKCNSDNKTVKIYYNLSSFPCEVVNYLYALGMAYSPWG